MHVLVVGDDGVGKSSFISNLLQRGGKHTFTEAYTENACRYYLTKQAGGVKVDAVIVMYDGANRASFESVAGWVDLVKELPFLVVGSKCDLYDEGFYGWFERASATQKGFVDPQECATLGLPFCNVSSASGKNLLLPVQYLLQTASLKVAK